MSQLAINSADKETTAHSSPRRHEVESPCPKFPELELIRSDNSRTSDYTRMLPTRRTAGYERELLTSDFTRNSVDESVRVYEPQQEQLELSIFKSTV